MEIGWNEIAKNGEDGIPGWVDRSFSKGDIGDEVRSEPRVKGLMRVN